MRVKARSYALLLIFLFAFAGNSGAQTRAGQQPDLETWLQFVSALQAGPIPADRVRPYDPSFKAPIIEFLSVMRQKANWDEWKATPEIYHVNNKTHFVIPLTFDGRKQTYCFTFLQEGGEWYFQHLESILLRLDQVGPLPVSRFPDLEESQKAWMREEIATSEQVRLFNLLVNEKNKQFAFDWFKDGLSYALQAKTWVPLVPPDRAFVLYLCWEQANLRGNPTRLERLTETEAVVTIEPIFLKLYDQTAHLPQQISKLDYQHPFETVWQDRAEQAGWKLQQNCTDAQCVFRFTRLAAEDKPQSTTSP